MKLVKSTVISFTALLITLISCSKEKVDAEFILIKSEVSGNKTVSKYIYNSVAKISENEGLDYYTRYQYDTNNRLVKSESAVNTALYSGVASIRTELMTSQNSEITGQQIFEYNQTGRLQKIKNYFKRNDGFKHTSMNTFNYDGNNITKRNLHNENDVVTQFNIYEYDNNGNVVREKYYTNIEGSAPKLIRETSFKYDNKSNPFKIFGALGIPGLYTNQNNIIEVYTVFQEPTPGVATNPVAKTNYLYNMKGFPVKVITENSEFAYKYE